jgi:hypothetical protein
VDTLPSGASRADSEVRPVHGSHANLPAIIEARQRTNASRDTNAAVRRERSKRNSVWAF